MTARLAVSYFRVSTTEQAQHALSIPDQRNQIRSYAERNGLQIIAEYEEPGASARDDHRPVFNQMMDRAFQNPAEFGVILVHSMSRFFRDELTSEIYYRKLIKHGVKLISITQPFGEGPTADLTRRIIAIIDEMNSAETAKHVHRTMLENARQGFRNGSKAALGYRAVVAEMRGEKKKKRLEVDPEGSEIIKLIYRLYLEGDGKSGPLGIQTTTRYLNEHGYPSPRGKRFTHSYVEKILKSELYTGKGWYNVRDAKNGVVRPQEEWIPVEVPPIVSEVDFQRVQERLALRNPKVTAPRTTNGPTLLIDIARCGHCGSKMLRRTGKGGKYKYYRCSEQTLAGICPAGKEGVGAAIPMDALDNEVLGRICDLLLTPERVQTIVAEVAAKREAGLDDATTSLRQLRVEHGKTVKKLSRLMHALGEGTVDSTESFRTTVRQTEADSLRLSSLIAAQEKIISARMTSVSLDQASRFAIAFRDKLRDGSPALRRRVVRSIVKEVIVSEDEIVIIGAKSDLAEVVTGGTKNV